MKNSIASLSLKIAPYSEPSSNEKQSTSGPQWADVDYGDFALPNYAFLIDRPRTELGLAQNTLALYNHDYLQPDRRPHPEILYLEDVKTVAIWNRKKRSWDFGSDGIVAAINDTARRRAKVASFLPDDGEKELEREWAIQCQRANTVRNATFFIENTPEIRRTTGDFNRNGHLLGQPEGKVLDTRTELVRDARPEDMVTLASGLVAPEAAINDKQIRESRIYQAFDEWSAGRPHLRDWMLAFLGYCLVAGNPLKIVLWLYGRAGNDGKSLCGWLFRQALGQYWCGMSWMSLDADRREERTNDIRRLDGKRSIWGNETSRRRGINGPLFKTLSGDSDQLTGRYHNQEFVDFDVTGTLAFTVNEFPKVTDADPALWNRMRVMPFDATFPENDAIKAELEAEIKNGMGLAVALHGLRLYKSGILERPRTPQEMTDAHAKWVERDDPNIDITEFLQEACDKWDASKGEPEQWRERLDAIHTAYSGYKSGRREHPLGMRNFREALEAAGVKVRKSTGNRQYVYGYMLTKEARNWGL